MDSAEQTQPAASDPIALYLVLLELALAGRSPALIHDAVVDAEAHLRAAVAAGRTPQRAVDEFGTPEEIAAAYIAADDPRRGLPRDALAGSAGLAAGAAAMGRLNAEAGAGEPSPSAARAGREDPAGAPAGGARLGEAGAAAPLPPAPPEAPLLRRAQRVPILGIWFNPHAWGSLLFFTTIGFVFALAAFVWVVVVGSVSLGSLPIGIGFVLLVLLLGSVRGICLLDGMLCEFMLGVRMPRRTQPVYTTSGISLWQRLGCWLRDVRSWLSVGYLLGNFPVALVLFVVFLVLTVVSAGFLGAPVAWLMDSAAVQVDSDTDLKVNMMGMDILPDANGTYRMPFLGALGLFAAGLVMATATLWLARGTGWVYGHVVQAIQVARPRAVLVRPVEPVHKETP
jgi:hypothetical protein